MRENNPRVCEEEMSDADARALIKTVNNEVYFYTDVTYATALEVTEQLKTVERALRIDAIVQNREPSPIKLHINSNGGELKASMCIVDTILNMELPVHTYIEGRAESAATMMSIVGKRRYITKHSYAMIHQLSTGFGGTFAEITASFDDVTLFMNGLRDLYLDYTSISSNKLDELLATDRTFTAEEALKYGLVDEILGGK